VHAAGKPAPDGLLRGARASSASSRRGAAHRRRRGRRARRRGGNAFARRRSPKRSRRSHEPTRAWTTFVVAFASLSYAVRFTRGQADKDVLYQWSTVANSLIQYAIIALIVYAIAGLGNRRAAARAPRPTSWWLAAGIGVGIGIGCAS
jgi:hypothetical protein